MNPMRIPTTAAANAAQILPNFTPAWFAAVMGTGVLAVITRTLAADLPWLRVPAWALHLGNLAAFSVLLGVFLLHCLFHRRRALDTLLHPGRAAFYATLPLALMVLAAQLLAFHPDSGRGTALLALCLWRCAVLLGFGLNFALMYRLILHPEPDAAHIIPVQFIPAVGLVVIPVAGVPLLAWVTGSVRDLSLLVNAAGLGAGSLLYLGLFCLMLQRHILHPPLPDKLTPSLWIHMAPPGWIAVSLMGIAEYLGDDRAVAAARFLALFLWGASLWWLVMAALLTLRALRRRMPFSLVWWSMIFPLGALTTLSLRLAADLPLLRQVAVLLWLLLCGLWALTLVNTLRGLADGSIFAQ